MSIEQSFIAAINANPDDRTLQLVYADWLDEQGDPRAEAWRVLVEAGKRPVVENGSWRFFWWSVVRPHVALHDLLSWSRYWGNFADKIFNTFHAAMNAAAIAWVRCHRDEEFEPDELTERV